SGLIQGLELLERKPSADDISDFLQGNITDTWYQTLMKQGTREHLIKYNDRFGWEFMSRYISLTCYHKNNSADEKQREHAIGDFLCKLSANNAERITPHLNDLFRIDIKQK
ncbi:MAG: hypothetical protein ACRCTW_04180, partial [Lactococcus garvieae]